MLEILGYAIIGLMLASWFQPLTWVKDKLKLYDIPYIGYVFYCEICFATWLTFFITWDILTAVMAGFVANVLAFVVGKMDEHWPPQ